MDLHRQRHIQEHFDRLYRQGVKPWTEHGVEPPLDSFLKRLKEWRQRAQVLDLGCGDGWIAIRAAENGHPVWGIDSSKTAIEEANAAAREAGVAKRVLFTVGDGLNLPYEDEFFDAAVDRGFFHHVLPENQPLYFANLPRVLRIGALFYLVVFSMHNPVGIGQRFMPKTVTALFEPFFRVISIEADPFPTDSPAHLLHVTMERR